MLDRRAREVLPMGCRSRSLALALTVSLGAGGVALLSARSDSGTGRVRIQLAGPFVIVPVTVEQRVYPFLLDTGSASTVIDTGLAQELSLPSAGTTTLMTSGGPADAGVVKASLAFGAVHAAAVEVVRFPLTALRTVHPSIRGVLGQDVLRRSNWRLDYRHQVVEQDIDGSLAESTEGERLDLHWVEDRPAVEATFDGHAPTALVLDSAATGIVLFNADRSRWHGLARGSTRVKSLAQDVESPSVTAAALRIGTVVFDRPSAALVTLDGAPPGGLLPTSMFDAVYFDNDRGAAVVVAAGRH
jgi:predicted aspartyl protease